MQAEIFDDTPYYASEKFPDPRPFQVTAHEKLREGARAGHRAQVTMAPTGGGKTYLGLRIAYEALKKGASAIFVCDRITLINQTSAVADRYGLSAHGVIQANHWRVNPRMPFQIASVQTLARHNWPKSDVVIIDECHCQYAAWVEHVKQTDAMVIGLSATPFSKGLGKIFTNLVNAATMHELTESGVLVPMRVLSCKQADMTGAETSGGEWTDRAVEERGMEIIGDVVKEWQEHAQNRKTIIFGATIKHCKELCRNFIDAGVMAAVFTEKTPDAERKQLLEEFYKPDSFIRVLISVEALSKGFDVPDIECVVDCRPLRKSLSTAIQMWGRGLRSSSETGKTKCLLLDHSGNIIRFAQDFENIFFNGLSELDAGEKLDKTIRREDEIEGKEKCCPSCGHRPFASRCISCGFEKKQSALIEHVPGKMQEIMIGKRKAADDSRHLWEQVCTYTRSHGNPSTAAGRAWHIFKEIAGFPVPAGMPPFEATPGAAISAVVANKIKQKQIAYAKSHYNRNVA
ncbi:helicase [Candidatus Methylospira mobilis]|uniref:Helicase n=1 Tax=Candidatus Methylospira mobilis TaxID=1808979 RepID=A0A5Q0BR19_9GAMM|nr:DEAD/DEAH box helicase family protein [Candidatus Methylospira mobilis]QFY44644.1 helicase [Candidatus Methylospira mobilis]